MSARLRALVLAVVLAAVSSACSLHTLGSPTGDTTLVAHFDDAQHLVAGHTVRLADVPVGTVTSVSLDGYTAVVRMSISNSHEIPVGTHASISATSLLGENYVRLTTPPGGTAGVLADGDRIETDDADATFEEITVQLLGLMRAIQGDDIATVIDESHAALAGRGPELNHLIGTVEQVGDGLVGQTEDLVAIIDSLAAFGEDLAGDAELLGASIEAAADATGALAGQRDRMVDTVTALVDVARTLDEEVLIPHGDRLTVLLDRLAPTVEVLTEQRHQVVAVLEALNDANRQLPDFVDDHGIGNGFIVVRGVGLPGNTLIPLPEIIGDLTDLLGGLAGLSASPDAVPATIDASAPATVASILFAPFAEEGAGP